MSAKTASPQCWDSPLCWADGYLADLASNPTQDNVVRLYRAASDMLAWLQPEDVATVFPEYAKQ